MATEIFLAQIKRFLSVVANIERSDAGIAGRILVVEDDNVIGKDLETILSSYGLEAFHVSDWPAAMAMVRCVST